MICYTTGIPLSPHMDQTYMENASSIWMFPQLMLPRRFQGKGSCSTSCISLLSKCRVWNSFLSIDISYGSNTNHLFWDALTYNNQNFGFKWWTPQTKPSWEVQCTSLTTQMSYWNIPLLVACCTGFKLLTHVLMMLNVFSRWFFWPLSMNQYNRLGYRYPLQLKVVFELDQEKNIHTYYVYIYIYICVYYRKPWGLNRFYLMATAATAMVFL